jgi:hypothetical protein
MKDLVIFDVESVSMYGRRLGWMTPQKTTNAPTPAPVTPTIIEGTKFSFYFTYNFQPSDFPDKVDTIVETMYSNMGTVTPISTSTLFSSAMVKSDYFSFIGYFDISEIRSNTDDYSTGSYGSYFSGDYFYFSTNYGSNWDNYGSPSPTPESDDNVGDDESVGRFRTLTTRAGSLRKSTESNASKKLLEFISSRNTVTYYKDSNDIDLSITTTLNVTFLFQA